MDQKQSHTPDRLQQLKEEATRRALEISELEVNDDFDSKFTFSILFLSLSGLSSAARTRDRKLACIESLRKWLKENNLTPHDCGIGLEFVKKHIPEYSFQY